MAIPQNLVDEIMVKCGRHCCICRRFKPTHLQVHHIVERNEGGTDEPDNLIAICLTCHSDVHTMTKLTRRFTQKEIKLFREEVFKAVHEGRLPGNAEVLNIPVTAKNAAQWLKSSTGDDSVNLRNLSAEAIEILLRATKSDGQILAVQDDCGWILHVANESISRGWEPRKIAIYKSAMEQLNEVGALRDLDGGSSFEVTHQGYLLADELMAAGCQICPKVG